MYVKEGCGERLRDRLPSIFR